MSSTSIVAEARQRAGSAGRLLRGLGWVGLGLRLPRLARDLLGLGRWVARGSARKSRVRRVGATLAAATGLLALDLYARRKRAAADEDRTFVTAETINRPPREVYDFFRRLENLPTFMDRIESVTEQGSRSHWVARLPVGGPLSWDAEIVEDQAGERIAWQTLPGSDLAHRAWVTFSKAPGREATEVRLRMELGSEGGRPAPALARAFTRAQLKGDLRRLKQVMETGEVLFSDASAHVGPHPAQPSAEGTVSARERAARSRKAAQKGLVP